MEYINYLFRFELDIHITIINYNSYLLNNIILEVYLEIMCKSQNNNNNKIVFKIN